MEPLLYVVLAQALALAAVGLRWLIGRREVRTVEPSDYKDGRPRHWVRPVVRADGSGAYLADAASGLPLAFGGVRSSHVSERFRYDGLRAQVTILLDGVRIERGQT